MGNIAMSSRRRVLRGMMGGAAVTVGIPLLDCFLDGNGEALAGGAPLPVCFGTWFQGLGFEPGQWEPKIRGANYEFGPQLKVLTPLKHKINIFTGMRAIPGAGVLPVHTAGQYVAFGGSMPNPKVIAGPTIDNVIADRVGSMTRFRSLEVSCDGTAVSFSRRGGNVMNPAEKSPLALYNRIYGPDFIDPNAAIFTPDPVVMARKSALSAVAEQRAAFVKELGASDRRRLDEYFTSLRATENQLALQLKKPEPLPSCSVPESPGVNPTSMRIDEAQETNRLFAKLIAHALACGQTQVFNLNLGGALSNLRKAGSQATFHTYTHEEPADPVLGYQAMVYWFQEQVALALGEFCQMFESIREGDKTLLDRTIVLYASDHGLAKVHSCEKIPIMTVGSGGGRIKTGIHVAAVNDTMARVGLTLQQAVGVPISSWGRDENQTSKPITEIMV